MASQPVIITTDVPLREFCWASLELLAGQSVLAEVLPSFGNVMRGCARADIPLASELNEWRAKSQQVIRLAKLHCGPESDDLISSLEQVSRESTRVIDALASLAQPMRSDQQGAPASGLLADNVESAQSGVNGQLRAFCEGVVALLQLGPQNSSVLPQTLPSLPRIFGACTSVVLAQLRAELNDFRTTSENLMQFAGAHHGSAALQLEERLQFAEECAEKLIVALELLVSQAGEAGCQSDVVPLDQHTTIEEVRLLPSTQVDDQEPASAEAFYHLAVRSHQRQDIRTAETMYTAALELDGSFRLAWLQRGRIRLLNGSAHLAVLDLTRSLELFGDDPVTIRWRGDALAMCGRLEEALKDYDRALEMLPESSIIRYNRAVVIRMTGRLDLAWSELERILERRANFPGVRLNRGLICLAKGNQAQAIDEFRAALKIHPGLEEAVEHLKKLGVDLDDGPENGKDKKPPNGPAPSSSPIIKAKSAKRATGSRKLGIGVSRSSRDVPVITSSISTLTDSSADFSAVHPVIDDLAVSVLNEPPTVSEPAETTSISVTNDNLEDSSDSEVAGTSQTAKPPAQKPDHIPATAAPTTLTNAAETAALMMARPSAPRDSDTTRADGTIMEVRCPTCRGLNSLPWNRLLPGKIFTCKRCVRHFAVQADGTMVRVEQKRRGEWREVHDSTQQLWKDRRVHAGIVAVAALALIIVSMTIFNYVEDVAFIPEDKGFPQELEPRAKMFTLAWLKGDFRTMRQLTNTVQSRELFMWAMDNPMPQVAYPATLERDAKLSVEIVKADHPHARVQVHIEGLQIARGQPVSELMQEWRQEGKRWVFQPVPPTKNL